MFLNCFMQIHKMNCSLAYRNMYLESFVTSAAKYKKREKKTRLAAYYISKWYIYSKLSFEVSSYKLKDKHE